MDLYYLKLFNVLASELSFSKTANILHISQPAVSIQIKKLEEYLGFKLFDKAGRSIYLTDYGKILQEYTEKVFILIEEAETTLYARNGVARGTVNIGASNTPGTYILPYILGEFKELHPQVETNLHIGNTYEVEKIVYENKVDFAINGGHSSYTSAIHVEKMIEDEVVLVVSPANRLSESEYIEGKELLNFKYIAHERNSQLYKLILDILEELGLSASVSMTLGNIDAIKQAVSANLGFSFIPKSAVSYELKFGLLKQLKIKNKKWAYPYNLIYYKNRQLPLAAIKMIDLIRERIKNFC